MDKPARRRDCFARVRALSDDERRAYSFAIREAIAAFPLFRESECVLAYASLPSEPDLSHLFATHPEKRWAFPAVGGEDRLTFFPAGTPGEFRKSALGFPEPDPNRGAPLSPETADLILVPGVSFDETTRARLGRGRGHYDRFLASFSDNEKRPLLLGVCFSVQFSPLEPESHDIPMDHLVTELGLLG